MALCYRVTGDAAFLQQGGALKPLRGQTLRSLFRTPSGRYSPAFWQDIFGQPEINRSLLHFLYYLKEAGIAEIGPDDEVGQYPVGGAAFGTLGDVKERGIWVAIHNPTGDAFTLQLRLGPIASGDLHPVGVVLLDPSGQRDSSAGSHPTSTDIPRGRRRHARPGVGLAGVLPRGQHSRARLRRAL